MNDLSAEIVAALRKEKPYITWGIPKWGGPAIPITGGTRRHCQRELDTHEAAGWWTGLRIRPAGERYAYPEELPEAN